MNITDVMGRSRPVDRVYDDGSWNCPFCFSAVRLSEGWCHGPGCFANPSYPVDRAREELKKAEARDREDAQRKANHAFAMKRAEEDRQARAAHVEGIRQEAQERGACVRCALHSVRFGGMLAKFTKHRGACPLERR